MTKFERIKSYNKKYTKELDDALKIIMPTLNEAYVSVFGEKYRDYITYTLSHLNFVYFIPEGYFNILLKDKVNIRKKDLAIMEYYLKYLNYLSFKFKSISEEDQEDFILKYFTTRSDLKGTGLEDQILFALEEDCALITYVISKLNQDYYTGEIAVLLPLFAIDLKTIIHELTHTLINRAALCTEDEIITPDAFPNKETSELINDYIASMVLVEYKKLGGPIPKCLRRIKFHNLYEDLDILVSYFYDSLSPLILESTISGNHNMLWQCAGEPFPKYCAKVKEIFNAKGDILQPDYDILCDYVDEMYDRAISIEENDCESFYQELESMGYRIRKLK